MRRHDPSFDDLEANLEPVLVMKGAAPKAWIKDEFARSRIKKATIVPAVAITILTGSQRCPEAFGSMDQTSGALIPQIDLDLPGLLFNLQRHTGLSAICDPSVVPTCSATPALCSLIPGGGVLQSLNA